MKKALLLTPKPTTVIRER